MATLAADISDPPFPPEELNPELPQMEEEVGASGGNFVEVNVDAVGRAEITKRPFRGDHFTYTDVDISYTRVFCYNPCGKEGLFALLGYEYDRLDWKENPFFHQKNFNTFVVGIGFFSKRSENWDYKGSVNVNFDAERANVAGYATFDYLLWTRYSWCRDIGLHFGFIGISGFKVDHLLPIIGFDWKINDRWTFNAIFPIDGKLIWKYSDPLSFAIGTRVWDSLHRVGAHETLSKAVWEYQAWGIEALALYHLGTLSANAHVGYNCGGKLRISNKHTRHTRKLRFSGAPYIGGEVSYRF